MLACITCFGSRDASQHGHVKISFVTIQISICVRVCACGGQILHFRESSKFLQFVYTAWPENRVFWREHSSSFRTLPVFGLQALSLSSLSEFILCVLVHVHFLQYLEPRKVRFITQIPEVAGLVSRSFTLAHVPRTFLPYLETRFANKFTELRPSCRDIAVRVCGCLLLGVVAASSLYTPTSTAAGLMSATNSNCPCMLLCLQFV